MAAEEKILEVGRESHETPQAITITIVDPSALDGNTLSTSLVTSVEAQDDDADPGSSIVMVSGEGPKSILQTVTETHMGDEELPIISNISNPDEEEELEDEETVVDMNKVEAYDAEGEEAEAAESFEAIGLHCLICNLDLATVEEDEHIPVFKTQTSTTHRKLAVFLGSLTGQKLTSRKAHSDILCRRCFSLLDRVDSLEVEIKETKEEIVNKYQETVSAYGGRARRRKPTTAKKTDYVFPKVEPEDEADQLLEMELDGNFEPQVEDLMEEDPGIQDEEWEPEFKKPRIKRESSEIDSTNGPPKRKRGRPRKDATKPKEVSEVTMLNEEEQQQEEGEATKHDQEGRTSDHRPQLDADVPTETQDTDSLALYLKDENLTCGCGVKSTSRTEHVEHVLSHVSGAFKCPDCTCSYTSSPRLARHQRLVHSTCAPRPRNVNTSQPAGIEMCRCGEDVGKELLDHALRHLTGQEECPVCAVRLQTSRSVEVHVERKHSHLLTTFLKSEEVLKEDSVAEGEVQPVRCDVCGKVVFNASRLARHRYLHHPEHYPWVCAACTLSFPSQLARTHHTCPHRRKNDADKSSARQKHGCSICNLMCKSRMSLDRHMQRSHSSEDARPFMCPVCSRSLASRKALMDHLRGHRRQGFPCKFCGAKLKTAESLNVHINEIHTHVVRLQCKHCPEVFFSSGRLSYHVKRRHTDRRSYTNLCHLCGKAYPYPSELKHHLRSHSNERPYKCDVCSKTFLKQVDLTYHKRSHTGERPHKCLHCDARFPRPNTLMNHIRYQHRESAAVGTSDAAAVTNAASVTTTTTSTATVTATATATVTAAATTATTQIAASTAAVTSYVASAPAAGVAVSSAPYLTTVNTPTFPPRPQAVTVMTVPGAAPRAPTQPTLVPVVQGQLVNTVVGGHMTEMQPVQYVQVDGLPAGQTVQTVPHAVQGMEYAEATSLPYQIVHLQILQ